MSLMKEIIIEPMSGVSFVLQKNESIRIVDVEGQQVADLVAFNKNNPAEKFSTAVTIDANGSIYVRRGDVLYSGMYNEMLEIIRDTAGIHDLLLPACNPRMFQHQYGIEGYHPNCHENLSGALKRFNIPADSLPNPFNIFMHTLIREDGTIEVEKPLSKAGDYIELEAKMDLIVAVSACSVRESKCNAYNCTSIRVQFV